MTALPPISATEWIRIFASRLAQRRPNVRAEDVLALAIDQFKCSHALAPELAAERLDAVVGADETPSARRGG